MGLATLHAICVLLERSLLQRADQAVPCVILARFHLPKAPVAQTHVLFVQMGSTQELQVLQSARSALQDHIHFPLERSTAHYAFPEHSLRFKEQ